MKNIPSSQELFAKNIEPDTVYSIEKNKYEIRMVRFSFLDNKKFWKLYCPVYWMTRSQSGRSIRENKTDEINESRRSCIEQDGPQD